MEDSKKKALIQAALLDLWKDQEDDNRAKEATKDWEIDDLLIFIDSIVRFIPNAFSIEYDRGRNWRVTYIDREERSPDLKTALFRQLQNNLQEGRVQEFYLQGIDPKYLDFFSPDYGEINEEDQEEDEDETSGDDQKSINQ